MGTNRLGRLPDTRPWNRVVAHIADGASAAVVAGSTSAAAIAGLQRGKWDRGVAYVIHLLARTVVAARQKNFAAALAPFDVHVPAAPGLFDLTAGFSAAVQTWHAAHPGVRTDLGEMAALAGAESIAHCVGDRAAGLFATGSEVQNAVRELSTLNGFAAFGHDYYARFMRRFLLYHLGRELSLHVGGCGRFADSSQHTAFVNDLETHCREAARVVREYVGKWHRKAKFEQGLTEQQSCNFSSYCIEKLRLVLVQREKRRG
jgi:hypothetical protein